MQLSENLRDVEQLRYLLEGFELVRDNYARVVSSDEIEFWHSVVQRPVSAEEARRFMSDLCAYFALLAEWAIEANEQQDAGEDESDVK